MIEIRSVQIGRKRKLRRLFVYVDSLLENVDYTNAQFYFAEQYFDHVHYKEFWILLNALKQLKITIRNVFDKLKQRACTKILRV